MSAPEARAPEIGSSVTGMIVKTATMISQAAGKRFL